MHTILVIEDDHSIRSAIEDILDLEGFNVLTAEDGKVGIEIARAERPTLIVCDIMMPYLDGYGVLAELRKHTETATIPFIFLTARSTDNDVRHGMNLGADDYLTKPFRAEALVSAVQARIERQARLAARLQARIGEMQENLLNVLPHELNTPLHGILAGIEFLREDFATLSPTDVEELLWIVHQSALRMRRLVSNSLLNADLRAADSNGDDASIDTVEAVHVAATIRFAAEQEVVAATRADDLEVAINDAQVAILPHHLAKIVEELINNACKYSSSGSAIKVAATSSDDQYRLTITNRGRGMSAAEIAQIGDFQQFQRKTYEQQGLGLGLAIAQRLLAKYQGTLSIESVPEEETTVIVKLPLGIR